jgi:hypothetical protein
MLAAVAIGGCHDEAAPGPQVTGVQLAKSRSQDPEVTSTDPASAPQDTTLDVEVSGSGFDNGSTVELTLSGVPTEKVRTNSTRYRNPRTLIANITIAADAEVDFYDVEVTTFRGKKGIGTEMFEVFQKPTGNATTAEVDFWEPGPEDPEDLLDHHNLRSPLQEVWRTVGGSDVTLEKHDFLLTLAFSQADLDAMNDPEANDPGECPIVRKWLLDPDIGEGLQARDEPLNGLFRYQYDDGKATLLHFYIADPFGEENGRYTYRIVIYSNPLRDEGTDEITFTTHEGGSFVHIHKFLHNKKDPYQVTKFVEGVSCRLPLTDFRLTVRW